MLNEVKDSQSLSRLLYQAEVYYIDKERKKRTDKDKSIRTKFKDFQMQRMVWNGMNWNKKGKRLTRENVKNLFTYNKTMEYGANIKPNQLEVNKLTNQILYNVKWKE